jgi:type IV fimbrial biogenesis protein FimT
MGKLIPARPPVSLKFTGFTLFDLLIALAIAVILLSIAVPNFKQLQLRENLQSQAELVYRLTQASRASSLDGASNITLCGTTDFKICQEKEFRDLMAFSDANHSNAREEDEPILYQYRVPNSLIMHLRNSMQSQKNWLQYRSAEADANPYGSFYLCAADKASNLGQRVAVSNVGRNRVWEPRPLALDECETQ